MAKREVVIFGAGGHARVIADAVRSCGDVVVGFVDTVSLERAGECLDGIPILGGFDDLTALRVQRDVYVAFGFGHCVARYRLIGDLRGRGIPLHTVLHPRAVVSPSAEIGAGAYIGPNAVVEAKCCIGEGTIVNCGACVCHESQVGAAAAICPGVMIGGRTVIGDRTWIGIGATCVDRVHVGSGTYIGAGATVVADVPDCVLSVGTPAKVMRAISHDF